MFYFVEKNGRILSTLYFSLSATCRQTEFEIISGVLVSWPATKVNTTAESIQRCPPVGDKQTSKLNFIIS